MSLDSQIHINPDTAAHVCWPSAPGVKWEAVLENAWKPVGQQPGLQNCKQGGKRETSIWGRPWHMHAHIPPTYTYTNIHTCGEKETGGELKGTKKILECKWLHCPLDKAIQIPSPARQWPHGRYFMAQRQSPVCHSWAVKSIWSYLLALQQKGARIFSVF